MKSTRLMVPVFLTYLTYFLGKVAYWRGWPSLPSELVTTQGWRINSRTSASSMLNDATWTRLFLRTSRNAASTGSTCHCVAIRSEERRVGKERGRGGQPREEEKGDDEQERRDVTAEDEGV